MSGLVLKVKGFVAPASLNLPKFYADAVIDDSTIYVLDSLDQKSWPSQGNAAIGSNWLNLVQDGTPAVFSKAQNFLAGSGFQFTSTTGEFIALPALAKLTDYNGCFGVAVWLKISNQTQANVSVFGWYNSAGGGYGMRHVTGQSHSLICGDKTASLVNPTEIRQVAIARVKDASGNYFAAFYRNGVRIALQAMSATMVQPASPPANAVLGDVAGSGDGAYWLGSIGRSWFTRKTYSVEEMDVLVLKDWNLNQARYQ